MNAIVGLLIGLLMVLIVIVCLACGTLHSIIWIIWLIFIILLLAFCIYGVIDEVKKSDSDAFIGCIGLIIGSLWIGFIATCVASLICEIGDFWC